MLKLNVGSGSNRIQDYISVDLYAPEADEQWDIGGLWPYGDESVDAIYSSHAIEHLSRAQFSIFAGEADRVLKKGGTLEIRCPDILKVCERMIENPDELLNHQRLYGLQSNEGEYHKTAYTKKILRAWFPYMESEVLPPSSDYELHMRFTK